MISRIQSLAVSASIYCSVIALLHICSTDVILWTAGGSENPCLSRGHIELLSHTRPLWRSLECCQQPASQLSPACVTLGKGRKRKGKQVKQILSAMVPQQTPKQDTHTHKKKKEKLWQYWQYKGSTSFNMHAQDFTRVYVTPEESHLNLGLSWSASSSRT